MAEILWAIPVIIVLVIGGINNAVGPKANESDVRAKAERVAAQKEEELSKWPKSTDPYYTTKTPQK